MFGHPPLYPPEVWRVGPHPIKEGGFAIGYPAACRSEENLSAGFVAEIPTNRGCRVVHSQIKQNRWHECSLSIAPLSDQISSAGRSSLNALLVIVDA